MGRRATHGTYIPHPIKRYATRIQLVQGRRSANRELWEARYCVHGVWTPQPHSLSTTNQFEAAQAAIEELTRREAGIVPQPRKVKTVVDAAALALTRLQAEVDRVTAAGAVQKAHTIKQKVRLIQTRIIPDMGASGLVEANGPDAMQRWQDRLTVTTKMKGAEPRPPSRSMIGNLNGAWQQVMREAHAAGWIKKAQIGHLRQADFDKGDRRPPFTEEDVALIARFMTDDWVEAGHTELKCEHRRMLRALVALLATTGMRAGVEAETLTRPQVQFTKDNAGKPIIRVVVRSHQGKHAASRVAFVDERVPVAARTILRDYIAWRQPGPFDALFSRKSDGQFANLGVTFDALLADIGIKIDAATGDKRVLYSLRHYYATRQLLRGVPVATVSALLGTSPAMIHLHYGHVARELESHHVTGSRDQVGMLSALLRTAPVDEHEVAETPEEVDAYEGDPVSVVVEQPVAPKLVDHAGKLIAMWTSLLKGKSAAAWPDVVTILLSDVPPGDRKATYYTAGQTLVTAGLLTFGELMERASEVRMSDKPALTVVEGGVRSAG